MVHKIVWAILLVKILSLVISTYNLTEYLVFLLAKPGNPFGVTVRQGHSPTWLVGEQIGTAHIEDMSIYQSCKSTCPQFNFWRIHLKTIFAHIQNGLSLQ